MPRLNPRFPVPRWSTLPTLLGLFVACGARSNVGQPLDGSGGQAGVGAGGGAASSGGGGHTGGTGVASGGQETGGGGGVAVGGVSAGGMSASGGLESSSGGTEPVEPCPDGTYDADPGSQQLCSPLSHCAAGQYVSVAPTPWSDRICEDCVKGFADGPEPPSCTPWTECGIDEVVVVLGTPTSDRECAWNPAILSVASTSSPLHARNLVNPPGHIVTGSTYQGLLKVTSLGEDFSEQGANPFPPVGSSAYAADPALGAMARSRGGSVFLAGSTTGGLFSSQGSGGVDVFFVALDSSGLNTLGTWQVGGPSNDWFAAAAATPTDGLVIVGATDQEAPQYSQATSTVLWRWEPAGQPETQVLGPASAYFYPSGVGVDDSGVVHVLMTGASSELWKVSSTGQITQTVVLLTGGNTCNYCYHLAVTPLGARYVSGSGYIGEDAYSTILSRLASNGSASWSMPLPESLSVARLLSVDEGVVVVGNFVGDPNGADSSAVGAFVVELGSDQSGGRAVQFGGTQPLAVLDAAVADSGRIDVLVRQPPDAYSPTIIVQIPP